MHKKNWVNFFERFEDDYIPRFNLENLYEAPISFLPTYKYDSQGRFIWDKNPSYADRVLYSYSKNLIPQNNIWVIEYNSFKIEDFDSDHQAV